MQVCRLNSLKHHKASYASVLFLHRHDPDVAEVLNYVALDKKVSNPLRCNAIHIGGEAAVICGGFI
jgi:hypothetical protein